MLRHGCSRSGSCSRPIRRPDRRVKEGDFGDASFVTTKELRANLAEIVNRVAFGGEQIVVKRHGKPLIAIVATYDLQACQALEDYNDAEEWDRVEASGELDEPGIPWEEVKKDIGQ
jgi:prevent-host-death family protein